jgi:NADH dehydrogenase FAD-containing subunit
MSGKTILILGGGIGGLMAANELRRLLPNEHRIVLIEKNSQHANRANATQKTPVRAFLNL